MRPRLPLVGIVLTSIPHALSWDHVSPDELSQKIEGAGPTLVAFIDASEPRSQSLESEWSTAAESHGVQLVSIDCSSHATICESHGITDYPAIRLFLKATEDSIPYEGPRRAAAILNFAQRHSRPLITELSEDDLRSFRMVDETVVVGFISPKDGTSRAAFERVARVRRAEFTFGIVSDADAIARQDIKSPTVVVYRKQDGDAVPIKEFADVDALDGLVLEAARPVIGELMPANHQRLLDLGRPMVYIFAPTETERARLRIKLAKFARSQRDTLTVVTADPLDFPGLPEKLGLLDAVHADSTKPLYPAGAVHQLSTGHIYPYPRGRPITDAALKAWGLDLWQGRVKPWKPEGERDDEGDEGGAAAQIRKKVSMHPELMKKMGIKIKVGGRDEL